MTQMASEPIPVIGPPWAAHARELEDYTLPAGTVAVLQWDDGEGLDLTSWLECIFYKAGNWPSTASWSLPADAPEPQLVQWIRDYLRLEDTGQLWSERAAVVEAVGTGVFKRRAVLLVGIGA